MATRNKDSKAGKKLQEDMQSMISALQTHYPATGTLPVEGHDVPTSAVIGTFSEACGMQAKVDAAKATWIKAVADRDAAIPGAKAYLRTVRAAILAQKGAESSELAAFGIVLPTSRAPMSTTDKVVAVAKRTATRKARGTLGKRQREQITTAGHAGVSVLAPDGSSIPVSPRVAPVGSEAQAAQPPNGTATASEAPHSVTGSNGSSSPGNGSR